MSAAVPPPLVSIGVPVYNGAATIERALRSLVDQTHRQLEIIISDNASTDETEAIAERFAASDVRVRYHRQPDNIGAASNFRYVLEQATGPFFMWAAADDSWAPTFVEANLGALLDDPGLVGSVSRVAWQIDGEPAGLAPGTAALGGTVSENVRTYLRTARDNSRFYGLFRRDALVQSYPSDTFLALDLAVMVGTLRFGKHEQLDEVLMTRGRNDPSSYAQRPDEVQGGRLTRLFPMLPFTRYVVRDLEVPMTLGSFALLLVRNVYEHLRSAATTDGVYGTLARVVLRMGDPLRRGAVGG